jgi:hypothetical protein
MVIFDIQKNTPRLIDWFMTLQPASDEISVPTAHVYVQIHFGILQFHIVSFSLYFEV